MLMVQSLHKRGCTSNPGVHLATTDITLATGLICKVPRMYCRVAPDKQIRSAVVHISIKPGLTLLCLCSTLLSMLHAGQFVTLARDSNTVTLQQADVLLVFCDHELYIVLVQLLSLWVVEEFPN